MTPTDCTVSIDGLRLRARIGVAQQERTVGNDFSIDVALRYDAGEAMAGDKLDRAINYAEVVLTIQRALEPEMLLIEHAAWAAANALQAAFPQITSGEIAIHKLQPPIHQEVGAATFRLSWKP